jgi:hypothetical protein
VSSARSISNGSTFPVKMSLMLLKILRIAVTASIAGVSESRNTKEFTLFERASLLSSVRTDDWAQAGRRSLFLELTLDRHLDRKVSTQSRSRVDSLVDA